MSALPAVPFLILGQGLAGTCLALELERRGLGFHLLDDGHLHSSSVVAAGLCNPVTGRRLALTPGWDEALAAADQLYGDSPEWRRVGQLRIFSDSGMAGIVQKRRSESAYVPHLGPSHGPGSWPGVDDRNGSVEILSTRYLKVRDWLEGHTKRWLKRGCLSCGPVGESVLENVSSGTTVICCRGWKAALSPCWSFLPFESARGELRTVRDPAGFPDTRLLNGAAWLLPLGGGLWRAGATYAWDNLGRGPDAGQLPQLRSRLPVPAAGSWDLVAHENGVRPILRDRTPVVGPHPEIANLMVINGLGSKGTLLAPLAAARLADYLTEGTALPQSWLPARFTVTGKTG